MDGDRIFGGSTGEFQVEESTVELCAHALPEARIRLLEAELSIRL